MIAKAMLRDATSCLILIIALSACVTERTRAPTLPAGNNPPIPASGPVALPIAIVGRDPSADNPCASAFALVNQVLQIPQIEIDTRTDFPNRYRVQTNDAFYSYGVAALNPVTCAIIGPAVPYAAVHFGFVHIHDKNTEQGLPGCAESSFVSLYQFETPVHGSLIKPYFRSSLWERIDSLPAIGGRCMTWQPPPDGMLEWP